MARCLKIGKVFAGIEEFGMKPMVVVVPFGQGRNSVSPLFPVPEEIYFPENLRYIGGIVF
jgi:hypothetical protein